MGRYYLLLFWILSCGHGLFLQQPEEGLGGSKTFVNYDETNPWAFHIFENFEGLRKLFLAEFSNLENLRRIKVELEKHRESIARISETSNILSEMTKLQHTKESALNDIENDTANFPDKVDFEGSLNALLVLYSTYKFDLKEFFNGKISMPQYAATGNPVVLEARHSLQPLDFVHLIRQAYKKQWYDNAIELMQVFNSAIDKKNNDTVTSIKMPSKETLKSMKTMQKNLVKLNNQYLVQKRTLAGPTFRITPYYYDKKLQATDYPKSMYDGRPVKFSDMKSDHGKTQYFLSTCNGFRASSMQFQVSESHGHFEQYCGYLHHFDPYLKLGPFKYEVHSLAPFVMVYHDFFTPAEMDHMIKKSKPHLTQKRTINYQNTANPYEFKSGSRRRQVIKTVVKWLIERNFTSIDIEGKDLYEDMEPTALVDEKLYKFSKKIEIATRLNVTSKYSSSWYQVTNYGLGGTCEIHLDPVGIREVDALVKGQEHFIRSGDTFATFMGWLADEPIGGATAFVNPQNEITVWPRKGSAAFWFSTTLHGYRDLRTSHGGCPILQGQKWILNKWIYQYDQMKNYPCGLRPNEIMKPYPGHF